METQNKEHPSALHLAALALGKLKPDAAAKVQSHLSDCGECRSYVSDTPRDELAEIVRQARHKAAEQNTLATGLSGTIGLQTSPGLSPHDAASPMPPGSPPAATANRVQHAVSECEIPRDLYAQSKYRIIRVLGRGGMGTVYEAEHVRMKRPVAIKVVNPELVDHPQALLRFEEEIRAVASLDHTNIARAFDAENIGSLQVFVMEFVRGQTLYDFLKSRGQLSAVDACRCVRQALIGLQHAHQHGLVHRDLKPQNLMLTRDTGQIKILDFGLAKAVSENRQSRGLTSSRATMGTYAYMAPEQALDAASADIRADIYSLGCTLYYLIGGALPFDYETDAKLLLAHQNETPCLLHEFRTEVPEALSALVARMLAKNPADRPQTPKEAADALLPFARGDVNLSPAMFADPLARPATKRGGIDRWKWGGIAAALLAVFGFGGWAAGLFSVRTPHGTIIVENAPADADVSIDGNSVTVARSGDSLTIAAVEKGPHHLKLLQGGREIWANDVKIAFGGEQLTVRFEPKQPPAPPPVAQTPPAEVPPPVAKTPPEAAPPSPLAIEQQAKDDAADGSGKTTNDKEAVSSADKSAPSKPAVTSDGFTVLFNGHDLTGWNQYKPLGTWKIENGILIGRQISHLYSARDDFRDVHLRVKLRLSENGRFCLYLRGGNGPKAGTHFPDGLELTYGAEPGPHETLYAGGQPIRTPGRILIANKPTQVDFSLRGDHVTVSIDGKQTIDQPVPKSLLQPTGRIILQAQSGDVEFESVEVKELSAPDSTKTATKSPQTDSTSSAVDGNPNDIAALFPPGSHWSGTWTYIADEKPVTGRVINVDPSRNTVTLELQRLGFVPRRFLCKVEQGRVTVLENNPVGRGRIASSVEIGGQIVGRRLSLEGTYEENGPKGRSFGTHRHKLVLNREDGASESDNNAEKVGTLIRDKSYRNTPRLLGEVGPNVLGELIAAALADADKPMPTPQDARVLGELCLVGGDAKTAERPLRAAIDTSGAWSDYKNLAWCLLAQGKNGDARQLVEKAFKDRGGPDSMYADADRATAAYFANMITEQQYSDQLAAHKAFSQCFAWFYIGQRNEINGKDEDAIVAYKRCIELADEGNPYYVAAYARWRLAVMEEELAERDESAQNPADTKASPETAKATSAQAASSEIGFVTLFNGKDLTGWRTDAKEKDTWTVKHGILTGKKLSSVSRLFTDRADFENAHVRVKARINDVGDSGVFVRWTPGHGGYEAQINATAPAQYRTGSIYIGGEAVGKSALPPPPPGQWFVLDIIADGDRITVRIDGKTTAEFPDPDRRFSRGRIMLHALNRKTVVEFKSVEVKELPPTKTLK